MHYLILALGIFLGTSLGLFISSLCIAAGEADERAYREIKSKDENELMEGE